MPYRNNPYLFPNNTIEKPIWRNNDFPVRNTWKLRDRPPGVLKLIQTPQYRLNTLAETTGGFRVIVSDVIRSGNNLSASGWRKMYFHRSVFREKGIHFR